MSMIHSLVVIVIVEYLNGNRIFGRVKNAVDYDEWVSLAEGPNQVSLLHMFYMICLCITWLHYYVISYQEYYYKLSENTRSFGGSYYRITTSHAINSTKNTTGIQLI